MSIRAKIAWCAGILVGLLCVCLIYLGTTTCPVSKTTHGMVEVDLPIQAVSMNLMLSDVSAKIMGQLQVQQAEKETLERKGEISPVAFLSGKWQFQQTEESHCTLNDKNLGEMQITLRMTTQAEPGKIEVKNLLQDVAQKNTFWIRLKDFQQVITITPVHEEGKRTAKTRLELDYSTTLETNGILSLVRGVVEKRVAENHEETVEMILKILKETAENPNFTGLPVFQPTSEETSKPEAAPENAPVDATPSDEESDLEETEVRSFDDL